MNHGQQMEFSRIVDSLLDAPDDFGRRKEKRHCRSISLQIQPLDHDFHHDGEPFWVISRDVSGRGLAFINSERINHDYLRIGLMEHNVTVIAQVRHSTSIGDHYPLYLIGVEFVVGPE